MASLRQHRSNNDRVIAGNICSETRRRGSTSQMRLQKILTVITTVPPPLAAASPLFSGSETKESLSGFGFDLNIGFCVSPELKEFTGAGASRLRSTSATVGERGGSSEGGGDRVEINEERRNGVVPENLHRTEIEKMDESLSLLIEAAKLIFGEFKNQDDNVSELKKDELAAEIEPDERKLRRRISGLAAPEMGGESEETASSPIVRSKRGRTQFLPRKYRDSVLEPLTRLSKDSKRRRR